MKRLALIGASLVLVGGMAAACGGSPEDADKDDFCKAMQKVGEAENEDAFKDAMDELKDTGTPKEIKGDARDGFEVLTDLDWDDRDNDDAVDGDDKKKVEAFSTKYMEVCMGDLQKQMEDQMDDVPTDGLSTEGTE
ncbi:hypothetical protein [Nocardioides daejeonensis]|uniref:hypothetical protein n=1 Tax=Nocardioides daejeonensis TaxID=1046556 RepID=UPI000D7403ED|nr:hypothetical protein [Nocardioides daejeonensis]